MEHQSERLRRARIDAGYKSAAAFAHDVGVPEVTYRSHELPPDRAGARNFDEFHARKYADKLGVNWEWLVNGEQRLFDLRARASRAAAKKISSGAFSAPTPNAEAVQHAIFLVTSAVAGPSVAQKVGLDAFRSHADALIEAVRQTETKATEEAYVNRLSQLLEGVVTTILCNYGVPMPENYVHRVHAASLCLSNAVLGLSTVALPSEQAETG
ncbi:MAG: helix-turn-helix transcriptional regulator [Pseudomonadota bacterium]